MQGYAWYTASASLSKVMMCGRSVKETAVEIEVCNKWVNISITIKLICITGGSFI